MRLAVASDHAGFHLKTQLLRWLRSAEGGRNTVVDFGCDGPEPCDYPDYAARVARQVSSRRASRGILLCGTGAGMAMAANKIAGIRAAVGWNPQLASLAAEHNKANVLCLASRFVDPSEAQKIIRAFLITPFGGGRHTRRVRKVRQLDRCAG